MSKSGGLFDFNGDGKVSMPENFLAYAIHESAMHSWRDTCEDGMDFDIDPMDYETEEEYTDALEEAKYGWRNIFTDRTHFPINSECYETIDDHIDALVAADSTDQPPQPKDSPAPLSPQKVEKERTIYTICGIAFPRAAHPYCYRTEDTALKIGDRVQVLAGNVMTRGTVVSIGQYLQEAAPFPVEQMKFVLRKIDDDAES